MKISIIALLFLVACGKNAPVSEAEKYIINHERPEPISAKIALNEEARDIIIFAFPEQSEVANYSYDRSSSLLSDADFKDLFSMVNYGEKYLFDITKDMTPAEKVQGLIGKVITIADARDNTTRNALMPKKIIANFSQKINDKLNKEFPCYEVDKRGHKNFRKCYLKPFSGITKTTPKKWKIENCGGIENSISSYLNLSPDENIPVSSESEYFLSPNQMPDLKSDLTTCKENEDLINRYASLYGLGKMEVATLVGSAELPGKDKLLFKAASEAETSLTGDHTVIFNTETLTFEKFSVVIDFSDGSDPALYGPEYGNMTQPVVTEINGSGFYRVDFEIKAPQFTLKTLGLSLEIDPIFGLRVSGKTRLYYPDGRSRAGIMRIDVSAKE